MLTYATITNVGGRKINEDAIGVSKKDDRYCFMLCDGLGSHGKGEVASNLVKDVFLFNFTNSDDKPVNFIKKTFLTAQNELLQKQKEEKSHQKMKTTAVCLYTDIKKAYLGYVGDSRFYAFANNKVKLQSKDHSVPYMLYLSKEISESEIRNHPDRNMLLKVMGTPWEGKSYEILKPMPLKKYQAFLLCTDGFWELVTEEEMCSLLTISKTADEWLKRMTEVVEKKGVSKEMDNFSAIAIFNDR